MENVKGENGSTLEPNKKQLIAEIFKQQKNTLDALLRFKEKEGEELEGFLEEMNQLDDEHWEKVLAEIKQLVFMLDDDPIPIRKLFFQMAVRYAGDTDNDVTDEELMIMEGIHDILNNL